MVFEVFEEVILGLTIHLLNFYGSNDTTPIRRQRFFHGQYINPRVITNY